MRALEKTQKPSGTPRPLIVRLCNWIGDVVLSLPALELLEQNGYQLHLYGNGWAPKLLSGYNWPVTVRAKSLKERVAQLRHLRSQYAQPGTPAASDVNALAMPNSFSSTLEMRLAGLHVTGYGRDGRSFMLRQKLTPPDGPHAVESFWNLACQLTGQTLPPPESINMRISANAEAAAQEIIASHGWQAGYVCVNPFAAGTVHKMPKKWPGFPAFVKQLEQRGLPIVICPGPGEVDEAKNLYGQACVLEGIPLDTYAALLHSAKLVVANDTGPAHIAAAVGAPLISVLGPTKVEQWAPWGPTVSVLSHRPNWPDVGEVLDLVSQRLTATPA
ncbi:MAG: glycosyltransferase family 9 protein [Aquabacterium sp.]|nr:glycosyltransferase family 9 protein [Aquabacterium sp.]